MTEKKRKTYLFHWCQFGSYLFLCRHWWWLYKPLLSFVKTGEINKEKKSKGFNPKSSIVQALMGSTKKKGTPFQFLRCSVWPKITQTHWPYSKNTSHVIRRDQCFFFIFNEIGTIFEIWSDRYVPQPSIKYMFCSFSIILLRSRYFVEIHWSCTFTPQLLLYFT